MHLSTAIFILHFAPRILSAACEDLKENCRELGFTGEQLCSDCARLGDYVKDKGLVAECRQCCTQENEGGSEAAFDSATLQVCQWNINGLPHIQGFIDNEASKFPNLKVKYRIGSEPRLYLKSNDNKEVIRIDHWKTEEIGEYLKHKLKPA